MKVTRVGFDIAKRVFQVHGVDENGKVKVGEPLARQKVLEYFAQLPPCLVGMETCGGAHPWGSELGKLGHTVKLMAAQFVDTITVSAAKTTRTMRRRSVKRWGDRTCISSQSRARSSSRS